MAVWRHQRKLKLRAHLMKEAIRNQDFSFRLPTNDLLPGERAMQEALNELGENVRQQMNKNEVESWERLTRVLTHEMMNATAPITSISQSLLSRQDVKGTPLEDGIKAIYDTSRHLSDFVTNYRKMSELEKPVLAEVSLRPMLDELQKTYQQLTWTINVPADTIVHADKGMLRQILMNLTKNAIEAEATKIMIETTNTHHPSPITLLIGNDGTPIPAENRQSLFVPFFTTKRTGSGIGLSLSRRMMIQQGGMLDLAEKNLPGCHVTFVLSSI
ncbi:PAS domain-containing sensor histidine kinase [Prevotella sp. MA2016]|uniref:sensor histidine kinase n=1 Tax=Prevotella sp. MA2016 TaxID=1408310 RepID=UPI0009DD0197|nr:HAMP domain-containing sensor histidine kinase [Prevotella sp. MA2016]